MNINVVKLLESKGVPYAESGNEHCRPGWIQIDCPYCNDPPNSFHMGINLESFSFVCWKCKFHKRYEALSAILRIPEEKVSAVLREFRVDIGQKRIFKALPMVKPGELVKPFKNEPLNAFHEKYLRKRGFDPAFLAKKYGILGTGGFPVKAMWRNRIVIPVKDMSGKVVSFQTRTIRNGVEPRYLGCPSKLELYNHRHCLYGAEFARSGSVVVVEGVFDAWRLGDGAVATFGIGWTKPQLLWLAKKWERIVVLYDTHKESGEIDWDAQAAQDTLVTELQALGKNVVVGGLKGKDPGSLSERKAKKVMEALLMV